MDCDHSLTIGLFHISALHTTQVTTAATPFSALYVAHMSGFGPRREEGSDYRREEKFDKNFCRITIHLNFPKGKFQFLQFHCLKIVLFFWTFCQFLSVKIDHCLGYTVV